jgi:two-component system chemotaxis sensor kinase CheA
VHGTPVYRRRGSLLPIAYLNQVLGLKSADQAEAVSMVVLQAEDRQFGLVVDGINDTQEIVVKPLGKQLKGLTLYAGATIMGDGRVALILDVLGIGQRSGVLAEFLEQRAASGNRSAIRNRAAAVAAVPGWFLRPPGGSAFSGRQAGGVPAVGHRACGRGQVVQYRNRILPLVSLRSAGTRRSRPGPAARSGAGGGFQRRRRSVGMVVDQILDVTEEAVTVRQKSEPQRPARLGGGGQAGHGFPRSQRGHSGGGNWFQGGRAGANGKRILVADASAFSRGMIRSGLDMAGYVVLEAANLDEAIRSWSSNRWTWLWRRSIFRPSGSSALLAAMRRRPEWEKIPSWRFG